MKFLKVSLIDPSYGYYIDRIENANAILDAELDGIEVGGGLVLECVEMDEEEFKQRPEFMGW